MSTEDNEIQMDATGLYQEEVVTDRRVGSIRVMKPIKDDGSADESRDVIYVGQAQMMTPVGALPLSFEIEAASLAEAIERYSEKANVALEQAVKELQELRREQASSIVLPGSEGMPPNSKIQLK